MTVVSTRGAFQAYLGDRIRQVYNNSLRANVRSRFFVLGAEQFAQLMREWFPMALHLLEGLFFGTQSTQQVLQQRERLLALGSLSAGPHARAEQSGGCGGSGHLVAAGPTDRHAPRLGRHARVRI